MKPFARMPVGVVCFALSTLLSFGAAAQSNATGKYFRLENYTGTAHDVALAVERQQAGRIRKLLAVDSALAISGSPRTASRCCSTPSGRVGTRQRPPFWKAEPIPIYATPRTAARPCTKPLIITTRLNF